MTPRPRAVDDDDDHRRRIRSPGVPAWPVVSVVVVLVLVALMIVAGVMLITLL